MSDQPDTHLPNPETFADTPHCGAAIAAINDITAEPFNSTTPLFYESARAVAQEQAKCSPRPDGDDDSADVPTIAADSENPPHPAAQESSDPASNEEIEYWYGDNEPTPPTIRWMDPESHEGAHIMFLLRRLHGMRRDNEGYDGETIVAELGDWLRRMGIDPDLEPQHVRERIHQQPHPWSAVLLRQTTPPYRVLIATLVRGYLSELSDDCGHDAATLPGYERLAETVIALTAHQAASKLLRIVSRE